MLQQSFQSSHQCEIRLTKHLGGIANPRPLPSLATERKYVMWTMSISADPSQTYYGDKVNKGICIKGISQLKILVVQDNCLTKPTRPALLNEQSNNLEVYVPTICLLTLICTLVLFMNDFLQYKTTGSFGPSKGLVSFYGPSTYNL